MAADKESIWLLSKILSPALEVQYCVSKNLSHLSENESPKEAIIAFLCGIGPFYALVSGLVLFSFFLALKI